MQQPLIRRKLASHCSHRTSAQAHTRAHVSINMTCSGAWLKAGMRGTDTKGEQREQRERRRARWSSLPHTCGKARQSLVAEGPSKSERVKRLRSRLGVCTSQLVRAVHTLLRSCVACEAEALAGPSRPSLLHFWKSKDPQRAKFIYRCNASGASRPPEGGPPMEPFVFVVCIIIESCFMA